MGKVVIGVTLDEIVPDNARILKDGTAIIALGVFEDAWNSQ